MDYHHSARLTVIRREELAKGVLEGRLSLCEVAAEYRLSRQTAAKWVGVIASRGFRVCVTAALVRIVRRGARLGRRSWRSSG